MGTRYAENTTSPVENSRAELERILSKHQADEILFRSGRDGAAGVIFKMDGVYIRLMVDVPPAAAFLLDPAGRRRPNDKVISARDAEERRLWRCLVLLVKAKFAAIEIGLSDVKSEFLANMLLPDNTTVAEFMEPKIQDMIEHGIVPHRFAGLLEAPV